MPQIKPLDQNWLKHPPPSDATVKHDLRDRVKALSESLRDIVGRPKEDRPAQVVDRMKEIADLSDSLDRTLAHAVANTWSPAAINDLRALDSEVRIWRAVIPAALTDDFHANARSRYADAGAWAVHFSMVRMTLTTFLLAAAWGVVSVKWHEYSSELRLAAWITWTLAGLLLLMFTFGTYHKAKTQKQYQFELPTARKHDKSPDLSWRNWRTIWAPVLIYLFASGGFVWLTLQWAEQQSHVPITWAALVTNSSIDNKKRIAPANSVDLLLWEQKLGQIATSLNTINSQLDRIDVSMQKLTAPTATPTPTPRPQRRPRKLH